MQEIVLSQQITDASISPNGKHVLLCSYGVLYVLEWENKHFQLLKTHIMPFKGQTEAIGFLSDHAFFMTNERGKLYRGKIEYK
jgi:hypothetical protein